MLLQDAAKGTAQSASMACLVSQKLLLHLTRRSLNRPEKVQELAFGTTSQVCSEDRRRQVSRNRCAAIPRRGAVLMLLPISPVRKRGSSSVQRYQSMVQKLFPRCRQSPLVSSGHAACLSQQPLWQCFALSWPAKLSVLTAIWK